MKSINYEVFTPTLAIPVNVSQDVFDVVQGSEIAPFVMTYADDSQTLVISVGDCRENTSQPVVDYLDANFAELLDHVFGQGGEFIVMSVSG